MKVIGSVNSWGVYNGKLHMDLEIDTSFIPLLGQLKAKKDYQFTIGEIRSKRTTDQNALLWTIIRDICLAQDGNTNDLNVVYGQLLEMAGVKCGVEYCDETALAIKKRNGEHFKIVEEQVINHKVHYTIYTYVGSSKFDSTEMNELIRVALDYAENVGVKTDKYDK